jgi:hypothetical protein
MLSNILENPPTLLAMTIDHPAPGSHEQQRDRSAERPSYLE